MKYAFSLLNAFLLDSMVLLWRVCAISFLNVLPWKWSVANCSLVVTESCINCTSFFKISHWFIFPSISLSKTNGCLSLLHSYIPLFTCWWLWQLELRCQGWSMIHLGGVSSMSWWGLRCCCLVIHNMSNIEQWLGSVWQVVIIVKWCWIIFYYNG